MTVITKGVSQMDDYDEHNEAEAARVEAEREADYQYEMAITAAIKDAENE